LRYFGHENTQFDYSPIKYFADGAE